MSRYLYWTILIGDEPTAFRAAEAADLKPTLVQLQRTHPEARLRWFERGRLWSSPAEAQAARLAERASPRRPSTWRPGGRHEDPRQKYKDAKKAKWTRFKEGIRARADARHDRRDRPARPPASPPPVDDRPKRTTKDILADWKPPPPKSERQSSPPPASRTRDERAFRPKPAGNAGEWKPKPRPWGSKPAGSRPEGAKPWGAKPDGAGRGAKGGAKSFDRNRGRGPRPPRPPRKG